MAFIEKKESSHTVFWPAVIFEADDRDVPVEILRGLKILNKPLPANKYLVKFFDAAGAWYVPVGMAIWFTTLMTMLSRALCSAQQVALLGEDEGESPRVYLCSQLITCPICTAVDSKQLNVSVYVCLSKTAPV